MTAIFIVSNFYQLKAEIRTQVQYHSLKLNTMCDISAENEKWNLQILV